MFTALDNQKGKEGVIINGILENLLSTLGIVLDWKGKKLEGHLSSLSYFASSQDSPSFGTPPFHPCFSSLSAYTPARCWQTDLIPANNETASLRPQPKYKKSEYFLLSSNSMCLKRDWPRFWLAWSLLWTTLAALKGWCHCKVSTLESKSPAAPWLCSICTAFLLDEEVWILHSASSFLLHWIPANVIRQAWAAGHQPATQSIRRAHRCSWLGQHKE